LDLRRLETLLAVARLGGLSRAADELGIAPSTAALHLSELERDLGVPLTERAGRGIRLTAAGRQLLEHADSVVMSMRRMRSAASDLRDGRAGTVRFGVIEPTASRRLPALLAEFCRDRPNVEVRVEVAGTAALCQGVAQGMLDLALCSSPPGGMAGGLGFEPLFLERLELLVPALHRLADAPEVRAADLTEQRLLVTEESCAYRQTVVSALASRGVVVGPLLEIGSAGALIGAVAAGLGIAFVPLAGFEPAAGTVSKELADLPMALAVGLVVAEKRGPPRGVAAELARCARRLAAAA
jgi:LysR family transcriptional regulator, regulator of the ytmI operon